MMKPPSQPPPEGGFISGSVSLADPSADVSTSDEARIRRSVTSQSAQSAAPTGTPAGAVCCSPNASLPSTRSGDYANPDGMKLHQQTEAADATLEWVCEGLDDSPAPDQTDLKRVR